MDFFNGNIKFKEPDGIYKFAEYDEDKADENTVGSFVVSETRADENPLTWKFCCS